MPDMESWVREDGGRLPVVGNEDVVDQRMMFVESTGQVSDGR